MVGVVLGHWRGASGTEPGGGGAVWVQADGWSLVPPLRSGVWLSVSAVSGRRHGGAWSLLWRSSRRSVMPTLGAGVFGIDLLGLGDADAGVRLADQKLAPLLIFAGRHKLLWLTPRGVPPAVRLPRDCSSTVNKRRVDLLYPYFLWFGTWHLWGLGLQSAARKNEA